MQTESEVFSALTELTSEPGFIEVLAFFTFKDTYIVVEGENLDSESFVSSYDKTRLSKTELATLVALTIKNYSGNASLSFEQFSEKATKVLDLFHELHHTFFPMPTTKEQLLSDNFFSSGHMLRESIFYSAEGAFKHQYRDISKIRYKPDNTWLKQNKGFTIEELVLVVSAIEKIQLKKANEILKRNFGQEFKNFLPIFKFNLQEIIEVSLLPFDTIEASINTLKSYPRDTGLNIFKSVDDFNHTNAFPIIQINDFYYVFNIQTLWESIYESPFFWFKDTEYEDQAASNRGIFTEHFTAERLSTVFGQENVLTNIDVFKGSDKAGEIDVLVLFGELALVIQAKSKKLTIAARKGNSQQIKKDFQNAVQDAYDQALDCSQLLQDEDTVLKNETGDIINISRRYKTILPICVVSDHYPALATQSRQFLKFKVDSVIKQPFVTDVFFIDTLAEMLPSPLHVFDYLIKRSDYGDSIVLNHELSTLAIYINQNLYFHDDFQMVMLDDNVTCDLELSMMARRDELKDVPLTPDGLLTRFKNTYVGKLLDQVSSSKSYKLQQIGFHLLSLDEQTINFTNEAIGKIIDQFNIDHRNHDLTMPISGSNTGITIHINADAYDTAYPRLKKHIERRKYSQKAQTWSGFCLNPKTFSISIAIYENYEWEYSTHLETITNSIDLKNSKHLFNIGDSISFTSRAPQSIKHSQLKIGRNEICPCGSGSKYKKCCGF